MTWRSGTGLFVLAGATVVLLLTPRSSVEVLLAAVAATALGCWLARDAPLQVVLGLGIALRLLAVLVWPNLSEDFYRFLWDGQLWLAGYHPLDFVPEQAPADFQNDNAALLTQLNSAQYFTVYPPLSQLIFIVSAAFAKTTFSGVLVLKSLLMLADLGVLWLLYLLDTSARKRGLAFYALCPLVILEVCGNGHFESLALLGVLLAVYAFAKLAVNPRSRWLPWLAGFGLGMGILAKLVPAIAGPAVLLAFWFSRKEHSRRWFSSLAFLTSTSIVLIIGFGCLFSGADTTGFGESLDLYFRTFEFNGSLYTLASTLGTWYKGYNWIATVGPVLGLLALSIIIILALAQRRLRWSLEETLLWSFTAYLVCATTVHPWYFIYLVGLGTLTSYRWPYLLSFTAFLSYLAYAKTPIEVPTLALLLEYLPVAALAAYEVLRKNPNAANPPAQQPQTRGILEKTAPTG